MLGKFTFLFDLAHRIPVLGSSREPVRFHLWVSLAVAALAAVGVERLARPGRCGSAGPRPDRRAGRSPRSRSCSTSMPRSGPSPGGGRSRTTWTAIAGLAGSCRWRLPATRSWSSSGSPRPAGPPGQWSPPGAARTRLGRFRPGPGRSRGRPLLEMCPPSPRPTGRRPRRRHAGSRPTRASSGSSVTATSIRASRATPPSRSISCRLATHSTGACPRPGAWQSSKGETPMIPRRLLDYFDAVEDRRRAARHRECQPRGHRPKAQGHVPSQRTRGRGLHPSQSERPSPGPAGGPAGLCRRPRPRASRRSRSWARESLRPADRGGSRPTPLAVGRGLGHGPDRHGPAGAGRGAIPSLTARLPGAGRHVRSRLVGDGRRQPGADPSRLRGLPGRRLASRAATRSSSRYRPAGFLSGLAVSAVGLVAGPALVVSSLARPRSTAGDHLHLALGPVPPALALDLSSRS